MSLDFYLTVPPTEPVEVYSSNYTHNVTPMWRAAGVYEALYESDGKSASSIVPVLELGVADMEARPEFYRKMDPINGWGSYGTAILWLRQVLEACRANPNATIGVSA